MNNSMGGPLPPPGSPVTFPHRIVGRSGEREPGAHRIVGHEALPLMGPLKRLFYGNNRIGARTHIYFSISPPTYHCNHLPIALLSIGHQSSPCQRINMFSHTATRNLRLVILFLHLPCACIVAAAPWRDRRINHPDLRP